MLIRDFVTETLITIMSNIYDNLINHGASDMSLVWESMTNPKVQLNENSATIKTISQLKGYSGRKFKRTIIGDIITLDEWDSYAENIKNDAESKGFNPFYEENGNLSITETQFLSKPKQHRVTYGVVNFRSKDYTFDGDGRTSYGSAIKKGDLIDNGFRVEVDGRTPYTMKYELSE